MPINNNVAECDIHEIIKFHAAVCVLINFGLISIRGMIEMFEDAQSCNVSANMSSRFHHNMAIIGTPMLLFMNLAYVFMQQNADNEEGISISDLCRLIRDFFFPAVSVATIPATFFAYNAYRNCRSTVATPDSGSYNVSSCWAYDEDRDLPSGAVRDEEAGDLREPSPFVLEPPAPG